MHEAVVHRIVRRCSAGSERGLRELVDLVAARRVEASIASVCFVASQSSFLVKSLKRLSTSSITNASSLRDHAGGLLVSEARVERESQLREEPDRGIEILTGRLTKIFLGVAIACSSWVVVCPVRPEPSQKLIVSSTLRRQSYHASC